jgi:flagellin-like protein
VIKLKTNNKKAISPIFATLIILAVVTVLFIPVFIWATGTTSETENSWELSGLIATERIVIEEVNLKANMNNCTIYVRNIGKTTVSIDNVFISLSDNTGSLHIYTKSGTPSLTTSSNSVIQGDLIIVTISDLDTLTPISNQTYTVKVFTHRGVGDTYQIVM